MTAQLSKTQTDLNQLSLSLMSTLDEKNFFYELGQFFRANFEADNIIIRKINDQGECSLAYKNGEEFEGLISEELRGPAGHVARSKRAYFCNNVSRDPLFVIEANLGIKAELCMPIMHEGSLLATLHLQLININKEFSKNDINLIQTILDEIKRPIGNLKMYLSARALNESLLKKIEEKEKEIEMKTKGVLLADAFRIEEREIIGKSSALDRIIKIADKIAQSDSNILIEGESGTGKELIARRIHCRSLRSKAAFIVVDLSALLPDQIEAELFGEELMVGGVKRVRQGLLESANGGSLFIENIQLLNLSLQLKLLQVIKDGIAGRVGATTLYKTNVRFFNSSYRSLRLEVEAGRLREDLFYALSAMSIELPALRNHKEDIEQLANNFLNKGKTAEKQKSLSPEALNALMEYSWPGNIRELQNVMERAYILSDGKIIEKDHLAESVFEGNKIATVEVEEVKQDFTEMTLEELEKRHIVVTLDHLGGNKTRTAKSLGITVKTLYNKLHSYGMVQQLSPGMNELH